MQLSFFFYLPYYIVEFFEVIGLKILERVISFNQQNSNAVSREIKANLRKKTLCSAEKS
jgi:hypothetical protein